MRILESKSGFIVAVLLLAGLLVYLPTLRYQFVHDDVAQIVKNPRIRSAHFLLTYFTQDVWAEANYSKQFRSNYYRPGFLLWLFTNYRLFGLHTFWWHLTTLMMHLSSTILVYVLALRLMDDHWTAGFAGLVFALHPAHIEGVVWISGATEPLLTVFFVGALLGYIEYQERRAKRWLAASLILFALALLQKETAVIFPLFAVAYDWLFGRRKLAEVPFLALTAVYLIARSLTLGGLGRTLAPAPWTTVVFTWPSLVLFYIWHLVWPMDLSLNYDLSYVTAPGWRDFWLPLALLAVTAVALWRWSQSSSVVALSSIWMALPILPVLNLSVLPQGDFAHDRYLYLPSIGFALLVALAVRAVPAARAVQSALIALVGSVYAYGLLDQSPYWANNLTLYRRGESTAPQNFWAKNNLGEELFNDHMPAEAIPLLERALDGNASSRTAFVLGLCEIELNDLKHAESAFRLAMELQSSDPYPHLGLGLVRFSQGNLLEAEANVRHAIELDPLNTQRQNYHFHLGRILKVQGRLPEAIAEFRQELQVNPDLEQARAELAAAEAVAPKGQ
jgi:cytochrome c-type biogenesis protein CcmH/NrfG